MNEATLLQEMNHDVGEKNASDQSTVTTENDPTEQAYFEAIGEHGQTQWETPPEQNITSPVEFPPAKTEDTSRSFFDMYPPEEMVDFLTGIKSIGEKTAIWVVGQVEELRSMGIKFETAADLRANLIGIGITRANLIAEKLNMPQIETEEPIDRPEDTTTDEQILAEFIELWKIGKTQPGFGRKGKSAQPWDGPYPGTVHTVPALPEDPNWPEDMGRKEEGSRPLKKLGFRGRIKNLIRGDIKGFFELNRPQDKQEQHDFALQDQTASEPEQVSLSDYQLEDKDSAPATVSDQADSNYGLLKEPSDFDLQPLPVKKQETTNTDDYKLVDKVTRAIDQSSLSEGKKRWLRNALLVTAAAFTLGTTADQATRFPVEPTPVVRTTDMVGGESQEEQSAPAEASAPVEQKPGVSEPPKEPQVKQTWWAKIWGGNKQTVLPYTEQIKDPKIKQTLETMAEYGVDREPPIVEGDGQAPDLSPATVATPPAGELLDVESTASPLSTETPAPEEVAETEAGTVRIEGSLWDHIAQTLTEQGIPNPTNAQIDAIKDLIRAINKQLGLDVQFNQLPFENTFLEIKRPDQFEALKFNGVDQRYTGVFLTPEAVVEAAKLALPETPENETDQEAHEILVEFTGPLDYDEATFEQTKSVLRAILLEK